MSRAYKAWAVKVCGPKGMDRAVLKEVAERVKDNGVWQFCLKDLGDALGISRNNLRRCLDRLAAMSLIAFRAERYRGGDAQAGHRFILIRSEDELRSAEAQGFSRTRQALERVSASAPETVVSGSNLDRGVGPECTEGGSSLGRRVGPLVDRRKHNPNPLSKHVPPSDKSSGGRAHAQGAVAIQGELITDDVDEQGEVGLAGGRGDVVVQLRQPKPKRAKRVEVPWPDDLAFGDAERAIAEVHGYRGIDATRLWARFEAHAKSRGSRYVDWSQAWRNWVLNQVDIDARRPAYAGAARPRGRPPDV